MFKKTITLTELRSNAVEILSDLKDKGENEAIQLVHRGQSIKVIITQERYFRMMEAIEWFEEHIEGKTMETASHPTKEEMEKHLQDFAKKMGLNPKLKSIVGE